MSRHSKNSRADAVADRSQALATIITLPKSHASPLIPHVLLLKRTHFLLWEPRLTSPVVPTLVVGEFQAGNPPVLARRQELPLTPSDTHPGVWSIAAVDCYLTEGQVYHYWFKVADSDPAQNQAALLCTDPTALTVDWRLLAERLPAPYGEDDQDPAAVVKYEDGELVPCDPDGAPLAATEPIRPELAAPNNRLVIYELPTSWARNTDTGPQIGVGTFRDVLALIRPGFIGANFADTLALQVGRSHVQDLGVNALELLPIADSFVDREWGYATSNYYAVDYDLGTPEGSLSPAANADLIELISACHEYGIRFFLDVVMAFGNRDPMENVNYPDFHIDPARTPDDPDAQQSGGQGVRDGFGGKLWRYGRFLDGQYDPVTGLEHRLSPARQFMKAALQRWMSDFKIDGIRMDSVNNVANWDFVKEYRDLARFHWAQSGGADASFMVVGEELSVPLDLLSQQRLDGLWNENFKRILRNVILGRNADSEPSFEWSVRRLIDCRLLGFSDGAQAVNYVGSHDVGGFRNERLFDYLSNNGIFATEERIKLAFACLLTAVGIPMIFAGDEFADRSDFDVNTSAKQSDPVNFDRLEDPFRRRVFDYVSRLVKFRTATTALSVNETTFLHVDFNDGKRVLVWQRGRPGTDDLVVVVANFSDFVTADATNPDAEYRVPNWPATPPGKTWREVTQARAVPTEWVGREPIYPWEAKVYTTV